jgi:integrase
VKTVEVLEKVLKGRRLSERSKANYRLVFRSLSAYTEEWPVSVGVVNEWLASLDGFADRTVELWWSIGRAAGRYMDRVWKLDNPFEKAERPSVRKKKRRYLTADELARVIRSCKTPGELLLVMVLFDSACRVGELAGLRVGSVGENGFLVSGKTGERRYRCDPALCVKMKEVGVDSECVFGGVSGSGLSMRVMRIMRRAGLSGEKLGAHTLRHSAASLVAKETESSLVVQALLQHDHISSSEVYIHDVRDVVQDKYSPLRLLGEAVSSGSEVKQLTMPSDGGALSQCKSEVSRWDGELPEVPDGVVVRPALDSDNLRLIREVFRFYIVSDGVSQVSVRCRELFVRMLRKVKS